MTIDLGKLHQDVARARADRKRERMYRENPPPKMNGLHISLCIDYADSVSRVRDWSWVAAFRDMAKRLGYVYLRRSACSCGQKPNHHVVCRLVKKS